MSRITLSRWAAAALICLPVLTPAPLAGQWVRTHEQFYLPASHNWVFRRNYPAADRLFNAFDYGHAILYEELYRYPEGPAARLEERRFEFLTTGLLVRPPRLPLEEGAIEIEYVQLAPEAKAMFEWAHILHRQIYDVLADERLAEEEKDREVERLLVYYRSRPDLAFSSQPKSMELMEGQYYSTAFRRRYPKFNGLIWAYHWLQVGLYEPLLTQRSSYGRQTGVGATVTRFRQMLENAPENMPRLMPMTAAIAPRFAERYPEAAIIFDNLHSMHDVISDILASPEVPRSRRRAEILLAAQRYRDDTSFVMTRPEWLEMTRMMGVENMGGPVTGFLAGFPTPTVERGAVVAHGGGQGAHPGAGAAAQAPSHAHGAPAAGGAPAATDHGDATRVRLLTELHERMLADPVIRARVAADTGLQRRVDELHAGGQGTPVTAAARDTTQALDFIARLLADPEVAARVHGDPRLHALWSDPAVQRRLRELQAAPPAAAPAHRHEE